MASDINIIALSVQDTLDQLFKESLIPFKLTAYNVMEEKTDEYVISFFDSRLHSARFSLNNGESIDQAVRIAVRTGMQKAHKSLAA